MEFLDEVISILQKDEGGHYVYISDDPVRMSYAINELLACVNMWDLKTRLYFALPEAITMLPKVSFEKAFVDVGSISGIKVKQHLEVTYIRLCQK